MPKTFADISVEKECITVLGSGNSLNALSMSDFEKLKEQSFVFTMNYAPLLFTGDVNMWSDRNVTNWMTKYYEEQPKETRFLVRDRAIMRPEHPLYNQVDYWFSERRDNLYGNYTIVWLLQLLQHFLPNHPVLILGLDMQIEDTAQAKWYDDHISYDRRRRGATNVRRKLEMCASQLDKYVKNRKQFTNGNPDSCYEGFEKMSWQEWLSQTVAS